ncbi:MAG: DUF3427 domain-containing protein [Oceanospirillaceae bacterium]|nr:DUF3427 domain-containing protein [Oceanospirillaceae bacterium]
MKLDLGRKYSKTDIINVTNENNLSTSREGIYYCKNSNDILLFVDLEKKDKDKRFHFNDYYEGDFFHWDSQPKQHINTPRMKNIIGDDYTTHLFARVNQKDKNKTLPFIYCGRLQFYEHEDGTANPAHIIFQNIDYDDFTTNKDLISIYEWRPSKAGAASSSKIDLSKTVSKQRKYKEPNETERRGLVTTRVGQGYYRNLVLEKWDRKCALTGCDDERILIASHILPWSESNNKEKLDPENSLLLSPNADALFDKHLISFDSDGNMLIHKSVKLENLGLNKNMNIKVSEGMKYYLKKHNEKFYDND